MRKVILVIVALYFFIAIADLGAVVQSTHPGLPIWLLVVIAQVCLIVLVCRWWKR
jgi:hypothetical protein